MKANSRRFKKPNLVVLPRPKITQQDLAYIVMLQNQICGMRREIEEQATKWLEALQAGAEHDPGANRLDLITRSCGGRWEEVLVLNGREVEG
jgi:hypothetical protein